MHRLFLILAALAALCGPARAGCEVQQRAVVSFSLTSGHLLVPATVNGIEAHFVLDTGAERSLVTPQAVSRLGIALDQWVATTMRGVGGVVEHANADPRSFTLGGLALRRATLTHDVSLTVGALVSMPGDTSVDGLLGRDFLAPYDLALDLPAHRLTLYGVHGCSGRFVPWPQPYDAVQAVSPVAHALVLGIALNGDRLSALIDTGATESMVTLPGMIRMGLSPALLVHDRATAMHGVGPRAPQAYRHQFARLQVGHEVIANPMLWVAPVRVVPIVDALLGADWLASQQRVWLSFATSQVFFVPR